MFGVGVNSDAGLTGSIVLNERNFDILRPPTSIDDLLSGNAWRGAGQEMRIEAVPGTQLQRYSATWREPYLFDSLFSLSVGGYYYERQYNEDTEDRLGARVTVGRRLTDTITANIGVRAENVNINNVIATESPDYVNAEGNHFQVGVRAGLTYDTRDSVVRPTEGMQIDVSYEQMFSDQLFPLVNLEMNKFFTLYQRADGSGRHVLALHSQISWAGENTPVYERYFAGGFRSIRGFAFRGVGPSDGFAMLGGDFQFLNSVEYQFPILANDKFYGVAFVDSGTVESKVDLNNYRVSAGFGVRFQLPMLGQVPIALDFGFPIVKASTDQKQVFSFWLGFSK
jgi:outer membrane protein insertion porin family